MTTIFRAIQKSLSSIFPLQKGASGTPRLVQSCKRLSKWPARNQGGLAAPADDLSIASRPHQSVAGPPRIGYWRGSAYEIPVPQTLRLSPQGSNQIVYWRGVRWVMPHYEQTHGADKVFQLGSWRGVPCRFSVAKKAATV